MWVCSSFYRPLHQAHTALRGTRWALPPDSPNPSDDRPSQAYSMTLEDKAPVPLQLFLTSPSPQKHTLALSQPWGHWLTQAKTGCATCNPRSPKRSPETKPTPTPLSSHPPYAASTLAGRKAGPIIILYIRSIPSRMITMSSSRTGSHASAQTNKFRLKFGDHNHDSVTPNTSLRDREKIRWTTPDSWCECATYWGCWVWMASTDVLHVSCMGGQSASVCMRELFTEPTGCLNAPQVFINTSPSSFALHCFPT